MFTWKDVLTVITIMIMLLVGVVGLLQGTFEYANGVAGQVEMREGR